MEKAVRRTTRYTLLYKDMKGAEKSEQLSGSLLMESDKALLTIDLSAFALDCVYTRIKSLGIAPSLKIFEAALGLLKCKSKKR